MHFLCLCRYSLVEDYTEPPMNPFSPSSTAQTTPGPTLTATPQSVNIIYSNQLGGSPTSASYTGASSANSISNAPAPAAATNNQFQSNGNNNSSTKPSSSRKGGVIFPSIKNKPSVANSTFATDLIALKDVKVSRHCCFDLLCLAREPLPFALSAATDAAS